MGKQNLFDSYKYVGLHSSFFFLPFFCQRDLHKFFFTFMLFPSHYFVQKLLKVFEVDITQLLTTRLTNTRQLAR